MSYTIQITDRANQDLREIAFQIAKLSKDKEVAKSFVNNIVSSMKRLETFPYTGALPKDRILLSEGYRFIVYKEYLVFYIVHEESNTVSILSIFNSKKDYHRIFKNLL